MRKRSNNRMPTNPPKLGSNSRLEAKCNDFYMNGDNVRYLETGTATLRRGTLPWRRKRKRSPAPSPQRPHPSGVRCHSPQRPEPQPSDSGLPASDSDSGTPTQTPLPPPPSPPHDHPPPLPPPLRQQRNKGTAWLVRDVRDA